MNRKKTYTSMVIVGLLLVSVIITFYKLRMTPARIGKNPINMDLLLDWKVGPEFLGLIVANGKNFFSEKGITLNFIEGTGAMDSAKLISAGKYSIGISSAAAALQAKTQGAPLMVLAAIFQKSPVVVLSLKENNILAPHDLVNKRIGVHFGSSEYLEYRAMMKLQNVPLESIQEVGIGFDVVF